MDEAGKGDGSQEDDPVVQEIDVYLSKQLTGSLHLFQYPVRPRKMTYDDTPIISARIKPEQHRVQLEHSIDIHGANYARSKGEQIALNVDGRHASGRGMFSGDCMDRQMLSSVPSGVVPQKYVVGYYKDGEIHLTPLKSVVQLRPGFSYLDNAEAKQKAAEGGDSQEEDEDAKPVTVRFARRETEEAKARRLASFENVTKRWEEEPWIDCDFHGVNDSDCDYQLGRLVSQQNNDIDEFQCTQYEYLEKLLPKVIETEEKKPPMPNNVLSLAELKNMSLGDQVKALLINAKVIRFTQLMSLLPKGTDATQVLRCVQQSALLVQGCWVVKSEILYPPETFSAHSGVPAEALCRARDYVMWRFTQSRSVVRKDISTVVKIPAEDVKDILERMAQLRVSKGWEFRFDFDADFVNRQVDIVQRQQMVWDAKFNQLRQVLKIPKADLERKAKSDEQAAASPLEKGRRRRTSSTRTKSCSMSDFSDGDGEGTSRSRRQSGQGRSRHHSGAGAADRARRLSGKDTQIPTNNTVIIKQEKLDPVSNGNPGMSLELKNELDTFVKEKLSARCVVSLSELKQMLSYKVTQCPPGHILGTGVSERMLEQTAVDVGCTVVPNLKEPVFALLNKGDDLDTIREIILSAFSSTPTKALTIVRLKKLIEEAGHNVPSSEELKPVLRELCNVNGSSWRLKCSFNVGS